MFALSLLLAILSYTVFGLGVFGWLTSKNLIGLTASWLFLVVFYFHNKISLPEMRLRKREWLLVILLLAAAVINILGALGPEIGFDALWYHLTLPKIWLAEHSIRYIPGSVFEYSVMPKLIEPLYAVALSLGNEIWAKLIHFCFGLLILIPLYGLSRKFLGRFMSLLVLVLFYTNLVVGWESVTAYVDLARTFFEILALKLLFDNKPVAASITLGLAITVKFLSLTGLPVFLILLLFRKKSLSELFRFTFFCLLVPLPWWLFSWLTTGNPFYPVFSQPYLNTLIKFDLRDFWILFTQAPDPISPVYIISAPLLFLRSVREKSRGVRLIFLYCGLSLIAWFITPHQGEGRLFLPFLPAFSLLTVFIINACSPLILKYSLIILTLLLSLFSIIYRSAANFKYLPVIIGKQTRQEFLISHLNFSFGDYYDTGNYLAENIPAGKTLLIAGVNNLFYLPDNIHLVHISQITGPLNFNLYDFLLVRYPDSKLIPPENWKIVMTDLKNHTILYRKITPSV